MTDVLLYSALLMLAASPAGAAYDQEPRPAVERPVEPGEATRPPEREAGEAQRPSEGEAGEAQRPSERGSRGLTPPPAHGPVAPPAADCPADTVIELDARSGQMGWRNAGTRIRGDDPIKLCVRNGGPSDVFYRVEVKSEDEAEPRRFETGTLGGGPVAAPGGAAPPSPGKAPACDALLDYLVNNQARLHKPALSILLLTPVCDRVRQANSRREWLVATIRGINTTRFSAAPKSEDELKVQLDAYRLALRSLRQVKAVMGAAPTGIASGISEALKTTAVPEDAKVVPPPELLTRARAALAEATVEEEQWKLDVESPFQNKLTTLQLAFSRFPAFHDGLDGALRTFDLGGFASGKRVTLTVYRRSRFSLEAPPVAELKDLAPEAEAVAATFSFHVYKRQALTLSVGAGVAGLVSGRNRDYTLGPNSEGQRSLVLEKDTAFVADFFLLVSLNLRPEVPADSVAHGPWLSFGFSLTDPLGSWMPLGISGKFADSAMGTIGFYLGRSKKPTSGFAVGTPIPDSITEPPTRETFVYGLTLMVSFDPPILRSLVSKD